MKKAVAVAILIIMALVVLVGAGYVKWLPDIILTDKDGNWLDTRVYTDLSSVLTALSVLVDPVTVVIVREETYDNDGTWPATAEIVFRGKGKITQTAGTLNMYASRINAPERTVFSTTGAGSFDFANGAVVHSSWFDNFDDAVDVTQDDALTLQVDGWEVVTSSEVLGSDVVLRFDNVGDFLYLNTGVVLSGVSMLEAGRYQVLRGPGRLDFEDGAGLRTSWFERFDEAIRYADDSRVTLIVNKAETLSAATIVLESTSLDWLPGSVMTVSSDLSIVGNISAGLYRIVDDSSNLVSFDGGQTIQASWFGFSASAPGANNRTYLQLAADSIEVSGGILELHAGAFALDVTAGAVGIDGTSVTVRGQGYSTLLQVTGANPALYLNSDSAANGSIMDWQINVEGLYLEQQNAKTGTGIRVGDVRNSYIKDVRCDNFDKGIIVENRDNLTISKCWLYDNNYGISQDEFFTSIISQTNTIIDNYFSSNDDWAIYIGADFADIRVQNNAITPGGGTGEGVYVITGVDSSSANFSFSYNTVENFAATNRMLYFNNVNAKSLKNVTIYSNNFGSTGAYAVTAENTDTITLDTNKFNQTNAALGRAWSFNAQCDSVVLINNRYAAADAATNVDNTDREIIPVPSFISFHFPQTSTDYDGDSFSTGVEAIDVSTVFPNVPLLPMPAGYMVSLTARDSGSVNNNALVIAQRASGLSNNYGVSVQLGGVMCAPIDADGARRSAIGYVPCDDNGDFDLDITATGVGTMDIWMAIHAVVYGTVDNTAP